MNDHKRALRRYEQRRLRNKALKELNSHIRDWYNTFGLRRNVTFEEFYETEFRDELRRYMKNDGKERYRFHEKPDGWIPRYQIARELERTEQEHHEWINNYWFPLGFI